MTAPRRQPGRPFIKMHGLRNHFVIVDTREDNWWPTADEIRRVCDVQVGVGADQLILIEQSRHAGAFMRILNTDGREAEACGNATRCVAWLLLEEQRGDAVSIETLAGVLNCERAGEQLVSCEMGKPDGNWQKIPLRTARDTLHLDVAAGPLRDGVAVNVGNPHVVFFVTDLDAIDMATYAPVIQQDSLFPEQVNVGAAEVQEAGHLRLAVYERGAGLTMACGSGACAAVWAARARGLTEAGTVTVSLPGGDVEICLRDDGVAVMTGSVEVSFSGHLPL